MKNSKRAPPPSSSSSAIQGPKPSKHEVHIGGILVEFPYQPDGTQLAFMNRVIVTLDRAQRDGHSHALLESPTGTGKSLSLLCSTLAWQQNFKSKNRYSNFTHSKPDPQALADPIGHGGGFIPETQPSGNPDTVPPAASNGMKKKQAAPTIFYASRTHSQISQVIREDRKTTYRMQMAILQREELYLLAVGYYRSGEYSRSRELTGQCLEIAPDWRQALLLKKAIEDRITKDGFIGIGITVTTIGLIAGGIIASLVRRK